MTGKPRLWRLAISLIAWWMLTALLLWLLGRALDQPAPLAQCVSPAVFLVALGEAGDWLRRRWRASRITSQHRHDPNRPTRRRRPRTGDHCRQQRCRLVASCARQGSATPGRISCLLYGPHNLCPLTPRARLPW